MIAQDRRRVQAERRISQQKRMNADSDVKGDP